MNLETKYKKVAHVRNETYEENRTDNNNRAYEEIKIDDTNPAYNTNRVYYGNKTLYEVIEDVAQEFPGRISLDFMNQTMTYNELHNKIKNASFAFTKHGITKGDSDNF